MAGVAGIGLSAMRGQGVAAKEGMDQRPDCGGAGPIIAWFNPDAEGEVLAAMSGKPRNPNAWVQAMEEDLEIFALSWCGAGDVAVMRCLPSREHLRGLEEAGWKLPGMVEVARLGDLRGKEVGGFRPWAWSPDASELFRPLAGTVRPDSRWPWREALPQAWFSKELGHRLEERLGFACGAVCRDHEEVLETLARLVGDGQVLLKAPIACAGRGHRRVDPAGVDAEDLDWIGATLSFHGAVVVEPWLERVADFSAQFEAGPDGTFRLLGMTAMRNDAAGRFRGVRVVGDWEGLLETVEPEVAAFLEEEDEGIFSRKIPGHLRELLPEYSGPVGVDSMVYRRAEGALALRPVVEVNVRFTMGRVALELARQFGTSGCGDLQIVRKSDWESAKRPKNAIPLNDPASAQRFVAAWNGRVE